MSFTNKQSLLILHLIIFVWGFTGILGELIIMESIPLVFNRMLIAFISLYCFRLFFLKKKYISVIDKIKFAATGVLISIHWVFFFEAINIYNVSLAVTCLSSTSFFTSIIDPILKGKKIKAHEIILSLLVIFGVLIIFISPEKTNIDLILVDGNHFPSYYSKQKDDFFASYPMHEEDIKKRYRNRQTD